MGDSLVVQYLAQAGVSMERARLVETRERERERERRRNMMIPEHQELLQLVRSLAVTDWWYDDEYWLPLTLTFRQCKQLKPSDVTQLPAN